MLSVIYAECRNAFMNVTKSFITLAEDVNCGEVNCHPRTEYCDPYETSDRSHKTFWSSNSCSWCNKLGPVACSIKVFTAVRDDRK
jgi:hypothetical protein